MVWLYMLGSKFNSKVWDMYFYFTPLKTYHPRLLRTYKKVIPSCFFFGYTQTPSLQLLLLLLFPSNFEFGKQHFKNFFDFPRFSTTKPHKRGQVPHELWCSQSLVRKKCTPSSTYWIYLDALLLNKKSALFFQTDFWFGGTIAAAAIPTRPQYFARLPT